MSPQQLNKNAVAAIRVSTDKQGRDGDSPEAQREQIERFAAARGIAVKQYFVFLESASKDQQPVQPAIDYCKNKKNDIQLFIIKSIDRFTHGGSHAYDGLKMQLDGCNVRLVDIYGVISTEEVNTLDHLGFEYKWSKYSPSKKSEILEAERAKDELRDIMSRMIGAEIRYSKLGYWMRQPPYGFVSEKVETKHGKRCVLKPHPTEARYMRTIYTMREKHIPDEQIVARVNGLGCRTRVRYTRDKHDRTKIIKKAGGDPLTVKAMQKLLRNPVYAGINAEKWTGHAPVKCAFKGLVTVEQFNAANRGKRVIVEDNEGEIKIHTARPPEHLIDKGRRNPDLPYRKFILCPQCNNPLSGSISRGKNGKYYPAYHCTNYGHYYRIPKQELEDTVNAFIRNLIVPRENIQAVIDAIEAEWNLRNQSQLEDIKGIAERITELQKDATANVDKLRTLSSATALKFIEEDLIRIEQQITTLEQEKARKEALLPRDNRPLLERVRHLAENLEELLIHQIDPIKKAQLFTVLFDKVPTYDDLKNRNFESSLFTGVNEFFKVLKTIKEPMVTSRRIELRLPG